MNTRLPLGCLCVVLGGLAATGCTASPDEVVSFQEPTTDTEALTVNALTVNALTVNALTVNALTVNALTVNALTVNALTVNSLAQPDTRELFSYIVSCALPEGKTLTFKDDDDNVLYSFEGSLGLAPEWGKPHGKCNENCQQWVSACVLARTNYVGEHVTISVRGNDDALQTTAQERATFSRREATYFGNIFSQPQRLLACLSPGETQAPRTCGPSVEDCGIEFLGACDDVCGKPRFDGSFPNCRGPSDRGRRGEKAYAGSITVFLKP